MAPIDAAQPPKRTQKKNTKPAQKSAVRKPPVLKKFEYPANERKKIQAIKEPVTSAPPRVRTMWILVIVTTVIIVALWALLFSSGSLTPEGKSTGRFNILSNKIEGLWESIKEDVLHIKDAVKQETNTASPEQIEELEEQVFPQFTDPTKQ
ncbi:MAG: hypothetical protein WC505_03415 [Patescibacteria group bacterium]